MAEKKTLGRGKIEQALEPLRRDIAELRGDIRELVRELRLSTRRGVELMAREQELLDKIQAETDAGIALIGVLEMVAQMLRDAGTDQAKIDQAIAKMKAGQTKIACNLYQAFINEVNSLIEEGVLLVSEGQPLIEKAENIMEELGCK